MADIVVWLSEIGLEKYAPAFLAHEIDFAALVHLSDADLKEIGLPLGPRRTSPTACRRCGRRRTSITCRIG